MPKTNATVELVGNAIPMKITCIKCESTLSEGTIAIGIGMSGHPYVLGYRPAPACASCGSSQQVPVLFFEESIAEKERAALQATLHSEKGDAILSLLSPAALYQQCKAPPSS